MANMEKFTACSICAHEIHDARCKHPWNLPFEQWPRELLKQVRSMVFEP